MNSPIVSVLMTTYGHQKYIKQAIESILAQQCNFQVELIISDDLSPDDTGIIVEEIIKTHPKSNWIKYIKHKKNIGYGENFLFVLEQASGKYIALCEGDDYWIDEQKLQKQFDYMEANPNLVFSFHNAKRFMERDNKFIPYVGLDDFKNKEVVKTKKLFMRGGGTYPTPSAFFKTNIVSDLPNFFYSFEIRDTSLLLLAISRGDIGYLSDCMCVYRTSDTNWSSTFNSDFQNKFKDHEIKLKGYRDFDNETNGKFHKHIKISISHSFYQIIIASFRTEKNKIKRLKLVFNNFSDLILLEKLKCIFRIFKPI